MSLYDGIQKSSLVTFGNRSDVCELSARELAISERIDIATARNRLKGQLEGKRIVKFRMSGADINISMDYIHKIAEQFPPEKEEVLVDETEESE